MYILGGFKFPVQETHAWHVKKYNWKKAKGLVVKETDRIARFGHEAPLGLFHMPIFGGLTKYVVIEASGFSKYWNIGWEENLHLLPIKQKRIAMLVGKKGFITYGLGDNGKILKLKIVGYGNLWDFKYRNIRLF
jgi:hypothetical protein